MSETNSFADRWADALEMSCIHDKDKREYRRRLKAECHFCRRAVVTEAFYDLREKTVALVVGRMREALARRLDSDRKKAAVLNVMGFDITALRQFGEALIEAAKSVASL